MTEGGEFLTYLDANSLVYRAQATVSGCPDFEARLGSQVEAVMQSDGTSVLTSDLGVLEFRNTLAKICRNNAVELRPFDAGWLLDAETDLMRLVADGRLEIVPTRPQAANQASALVTLAARQYGRAFGTWDTIHIITAAAVAHERDSTVEIVTADHGFSRFVELFPHWSRYVRIRELQVEGA